MIEIKKITKSGVLEFIDNNEHFQNGFFVSSKHRLLSHYNNPNIDNDDIVLLLAYLNKECVGYMGMFIDKVSINSEVKKIGWLSTWWVDSKARGSGLKILQTMYDLNNGFIGISHFTDTAKRLYDKIGYFNNLKNFEGLEFILRVDLVSFLHYRFGISRKNIILNLIGDITEALETARLSYSRRKIRKSLINVSIEYLSEIDAEVIDLISKWNSNDLSPKSDVFFNYLKKYSWLVDAPSIDLTESNNYEFSSFDNYFNISLVKIKKADECIGFVVLQNRNRTTKVLFTYFDPEVVFEIGQVILLHALDCKSINLLCYVDILSDVIGQNKFFVKSKESKYSSIISKTYGDINFDEYRIQYGDGDNCFT